MAGRRGASPLRDDSYEDDYSEDFDDDDDLNDTGTRRYKTRSPILRTAVPKLSIAESEADARSYNKTSKRSKASMSKGSGYLTPSGGDGSEYYETDRSKVTLKSETASKKPKRKQSFEQYHTPRSLGSKVLYRSNRGRGRGRGSQPNTSRSSMEPKFDNVAKRVMSARRLKINELMNQNNELKQQIIEIKEENRLLKKTQRRQDKALQKFEDQENDLPTLIQRQNNEVRSLKDQIRKWREKYEKTDRYLRDAEDELDKTKHKLKKLKSLADEKDLPERSDLNKKLNQFELELEARDVKIRELERHLKNIEKNHRHELGIERARQKEVNNQLMLLREEKEKLQTNVKEKEKEIQMKNIYANRMIKPPHRLPNSYNGTPNDTPPPRRRRPSEGDGVTPRERAKQMEMKRREEMRKQRELKQTFDERMEEESMRKLKRDNYLGKPPTPRQQRIETGSNYGSNYGEITPRSPRKIEQADKLKKEKEMRQRREEEEEYDRKRRLLEEKREIEEKERLLNEQAEREEEDRRMRQERERMKREAEDRERRERERKEMEERARKEKREKEERERRERERQEQERRAHEERRRFEDDETFQAERRKKDEILQKLKEIDEGGQKNKDKPATDPFFVTEEKEDTEESMNSKKSYNFTKQIENMHKGKPARKSFNTSFNGSTDKRKLKKETDSVEIGGYNPSFGGKMGSDTSGPSKSKAFSLFDDDEPQPTTTAKPPNKARLLEDLFGSKDDNKTSNHDDIFAPKPPPKKTTGSVNRSSFPWDDDSNRKNSGSTMKGKRENSSTLFGGGNAFVNDEDLHMSQHNNATSLTRRPKQTTTTFHTRPTVNAVDLFNDDDIEEVML